MKKLTLRQLLAVASMLFGLFFGAGNLIFPASMGQLAGRNLWLAAAGFLVTGVGLPLLGVAALGISRAEGLLGLSSRVSRGYGLFFTCLLYLTIGPFFAIPRCATVSYTVGIQRMLPETGQTLALAVFSLVFFAAVLFFSLRPGEILTWVGKVLNPLFLAFLAVLVLRALTAPLGAVSAIEPSGSYAGAALSTGLLEGYNTMDALASLAFGIIVVNAIRGLGVEEPGQVARSTVLAGVFSSLLMALIYLLVTVVGAQSRGAFPAAANGGEALAQIAEHYFGAAGALILAATVTIACLKTAVGAHHQLQRNLRGTFPQRSRLPGVGGDLLRRLLPHRQPGPQCHPQLLHPGADVPLSLVHRADPAHAGRAALRQPPHGAALDHRLHGGGGAGRPAAHPAGGHPGGAPPGGRRQPGRNLAAPLQGGLRLVGARRGGPRHRPGAAPGAPVNFSGYNTPPPPRNSAAAGVLCL